MRSSAHENRGFSSLARWLLGAVSVCVLAPGFAYAQATPASKPKAAGAPAASGAQAVEEIIVTAQYRKQDLQKTPIAITAISNKMLEQRGQTNLAEVTNEAPNVLLKPATPSFGPSMTAFIRGVGQNDSSAALEPGVGVYVDDVYYSTLVGSQLDLLDLDRIEVLRGPQGTLAGMNSIGGAVKLYSSAPNGENGGYIQGTYGSYSRTEFRGSADFDVIPNQLAVRLSGVSKNQDGYVTRYDYRCTHPGANVPSYVTGSSCELGTEGGKSYIGERIAARWTPTDRLEINLTADNTNDDSEAMPTTLTYVGTNAGPGVSVPQTYPRWSSAPVGGVTLWNPATQTSPFISYSPFGQAGDTFSSSPYINYSTYGDAKPIDGTAPYQVRPVNQVSSYGGSASIAYQLTDKISVKSITGYRRYTSEWTQDEDGAPNSNEVLDTVLRHKQLSQEVRFTGSLFKDTFHWVVGGFYLDQQSSDGGRINVASFEFIQGNVVDATNKAGFVNLDWKLTDKLEVNVGGRYTTQEKIYAFGRGGVIGNTYPPCAAAGGAPVAPQVCGLNGVISRFAGDHWDYRLAVQYQWTPNLMTYADVSTGFKGGGVTPRAFYPIQAYPFNPETMTAYEAGIKSEWFDRRLRLNLAGFYNLQKGIQLTVTNCGFIPGVTPATQFPCAAVLNAGNAHLSGAELEAQVNPIAGLEIDGSMSYLNFEYSFLSPLAVSAGILPTMKTPYAPAWKYNIGMQYEIPMGSFGSVTPRLDYSYQSSFFASSVNAPTNKVEGYALLNLHVTWRPVDELWQFTVEATNLTDKLYYLGVFDNRGSSQTVQAMPASPRQWAVTLKRKF